MEYRELRAMQEWGALPDEWERLDPRKRAQLIAFIEVQNKSEAYSHHVYRERTKPNTSGKRK